jgi:HAD superfamily hydrolase (TIGR01549 family)
MSPPASAPSIPPGRPPAVQGGIAPSPPVITFDAGQTLVELDLDFLVRRLAERDVTVTIHSLIAAAPAAWRRFDELVDSGIGHPWHELMTALLTTAGVAAPAPLVAWLWDEQPRANLWRRPIPGMIELARELAAKNARVGVLSNSEGRLAELFAEIDQADPFAAIIDSGRIGIEKPDPRIFAHALATLGGPDADPTTAIHIGDSWPADIAGARAAGWRAIWFGRRVSPVTDPAVAIARDATELRAVLARWGVL